MSFSVKATESTPVSSIQVTPIASPEESGSKQCICIAYYKTAECPYGNFCEHAHHFCELANDTKASFLSHVPSEEISPHFFGCTPSTISHNSAGEFSGFTPEGITPESALWYKSNGTTGSVGGDTPSFRQSFLLPQIKGVASSFTKNNALSLSSSPSTNQTLLQADRSGDDNFSSGTVMAAPQTEFVSAAMRGRKELFRAKRSSSHSSARTAGDFFRPSAPGVGTNASFSLRAEATEVSSDNATPSRNLQQTLSLSVCKSSANERQTAAQQASASTSSPTHGFNSSLSASTISSNPLSRSLTKGNDHLTSISSASVSNGTQKQANLPSKTTRRQAAMLPQDCQYPHQAFQGTYYDILGLPTGAPREEILSKYRQWHLDGFRLLHEEDAERAEKEDCLIVEARNVLGNPNIRQEYDDILRDAGITF